MQNYLILILTFVVYLSKNRALYINANSYYSSPEKNPSSFKMPRASRNEMEINEGLCDDLWPLLCGILIQFMMTTIITLLVCVYFTWRTRQCQSPFVNYLSHFHHHISVERVIALHTHLSFHHGRLGLCESESFTICSHSLRQICSPASICYATTTDDPQISAIARFPVAPPSRLKRYVVAHAGLTPASCVNLFDASTPLGSIFRTLAGHCWSWRPTRRSGSGCDKWRLLSSVNAGRKKAPQSAQLVMALYTFNWK